MVACLSSLETPVQPQRQPSWPTGGGGVPCWGSTGIERVLGSAGDAATAIFDAADNDAGSDRVEAVGCQGRTL